MLVRILLNLTLSQTLVTTQARSHRWTNHDRLCQRQWARVLAASAGITSPVSFGATLKSPAHPTAGAATTAAARTEATELQTAQAQLTQRTARIVIINYLLLSLQNILNNIFITYILHE